MQIYKITSENIFIERCGSNFEVDVYTCCYGPLSKDHLQVYQEHTASLQKDSFCWNK